MSKQQVPDTLQLVRGDDVLGTIEVKHGAGDFPWFSGVFRPSAKFEAVRALFEQELQLLRANTNDDPTAWEGWEDVHAELHEPGLRLQGEDRAYIADEILIHIDGGEAWWRCE
jgi:hypothetical protein